MLEASTTRAHLLPKVAFAAPKAERKRRRFHRQGHGPRLNAPKTAPEEVVRCALDALEASQEEVFADDVSKNVEQALSHGVYLHAVNW